VIEVYAVTERSDAPLPRLGRLEFAAHGEIAGVYSQTDRERKPSAEALWRHERIVEALMVDRAVLPMRYGTVLTGEAQLRDVLAERSEEFSRLLDTVRGRVELALRVLPTESEPDAPDRACSGREYMEARLYRRRQGEQARTLLRPLERVANAHRVRAPSTDGVARRSYLVERERVDDFNGLVRQLQASHPELRMTCTGPWPPYSFVSGER
jgi:Gas vesicle synthesis protein GvpL/GvpF